MIQFITIPSINKLKESKLQYLDFLTYFTLRSYRNSSTGIAFPSLEKISEVSSLSREFVITSIKRLEEAKLIEVKRTLKKVNNYSFTEFDRFEMIPIELFKDSNLTPQEKAILIVLRQFFYSDSLITTYSLQGLAEALNVSYATIQRQISSLKKKGYISTQLRYFATEVEGQKLLKERETIMLNQEKVNWKLIESVKQLHGNDIEILEIIEKMELTDEVRMKLDTLKKKFQQQKEETESELFYN